MILKDLIAISGAPGLYRFVAQGKNAVIVEHLETGKRTSAHASAKVSSLEDIAVFTDTEEIPLSEVFNKIHEKENGGSSIDHKSSGEDLKKYFSEILPDYDKDRVYVSDMKKIIQWYNLLHSLDLLVMDEETESEENAENDTSSADKVETEKETGAGEKAEPAASPKDKAEAKNETESGDKS